MNKEDELLIKRFHDLANRSYMRSQYETTHFLNEMQQDIVLREQQQLPVDVTLEGGLAFCERKIAVFGSESLFGYDSTISIPVLRIEPVAKKYADALTHRDVLGAVLNLGLDRDMIGDILFDKQDIYLFCLEPADRVIKEQLGKIKHTIVRVTDSSCEDLDSLHLSEGEEQRVLVPSLRLDAVIAQVYHMSRQESQELIRERKVFISGRLSENNSGLLKEACMVSVRGKGRFRFNRVVYETKKGKLQISINLF